MWGATWILRVRVNPATGWGAKQSNGGKKKKRARQQQQEEEAVGGGEGEKSAAKQAEGERFKLTQTFRPVLGLDYVGKGELVVVERPWLDLVAGLPGGYFRGGKYGT